MITDWVGGVQKGQNIDYVIYEWSLSTLLEETNGTGRDLCSKWAIFNKVYPI